jgi:hypothetical protein
MKVTTYTTMHVPVSVHDEPRSDGRYRVDACVSHPLSFFATAEQLRELCDEVPESAKAPEPPATVTVELPRAYVEAWAGKYGDGHLGIYKACRAALDAEGEK